MTGMWYCCIGPQQHGPLPFEQLQQWVAQGYLKPDDNVCQVGQQQWNLVRNVPGLLAPGLQAPGLQAPGYAPQGVPGSYPQEAYPQSPAGPDAGFNFPSVGTSSPSTSSKPYRRPEKKNTAFQVGAGIFVTIVAVLGIVSRVARVTLQTQSAAQQRAQEQAKQRQYEARQRKIISDASKPPPIQYGPSVDMDEINREYRKALRPRP